MSDPTPRHQLFEAARIRADWSVQQLWVGYLALGGSCDAFDIEAFLQGLGPLGDPHQDILANALNERLDDLYLAVKVPYLDVLDVPRCTCQDPLTVLDHLQAAHPYADHAEG